MKRAQELSLQDNIITEVEKPKPAEAFNDPDFMKQLIEEIPELDKEDPELKKLLEKKDDANKKWEALLIIFISLFF